MRAGGPTASSDAGLRDPITGIAGCGAREASGPLNRRAGEHRHELGPPHLEHGDFLTWDAGGTRYVWAVSDR
jgi:hypothetical protein